jgi:hypothetical protein
METGSATETGADDINKAFQEYVDKRLEVMQEKLQRQFDAKLALAMQEFQLNDSGIFIFNFTFIFVINNSSYCNYR